MARLSTFTKANFNTLTRDLLDDPDLKFWSATSLDLLTRVTQDSLFSQLLDKFPYFVSNQDILATITQPGNFVNVGDSGPLTKRFHRIQALVIDNQEYMQTDRRNLLIDENDELQATNTRSDFVYFWYGEELRIIPSANTSPSTDVQVRYSFKPAPFNTLADPTVIDWPDGHEMALSAAVAARGMSKGAREDNGQLKAEAAEAWTLLIQDIEKQSHGPLQPYLDDSPEAWGGE